MPTQPITLNIHPELQGLIPPLSDDERRQLIVNLRDEGCRDAIVVWQEEKAILDGHNRYDICQTYEIPFETKAVSLPDLDAAQAWILRHQLGRRNLTPEQMSYLRGKQYAMEKKASRGGGDRKSEEAKNQKGQNALFDSTASKLGNDHNVSPDTIKRDAAFAAAVDTIAEVAPEAKQAILSHDTKLARDDVKALASIAKDSPQAAKNVLAEVKQAKTSKAAKLAVRDVAKARAKTPPPVAVPLTALPREDQLAALQEARHEATSKVPTAKQTRAVVSRTQEEETARAAQTQRLFQLFDALETLATLPTLETLLAAIPASSAYRVEQYLDAALTTLTQFAALWKAHRDEAAHHLQGAPEPTSLVPEVPAEPQCISQPAQALRCEETGPVPPREAMQDTKQQATQPGANPATPKTYLGVLCHRGHDYQGTGQSLRQVINSDCLQCDAERHRQRRQAKRQAESGTPGRRQR